MPHSLRAKLSGLRYKGILEDKDYKRLCHALDLEKAEQEQKSGKWIVGRIFPTKVGDENLIEYRCSECDRTIRCTESQLVNYPYCHCGAEMESEE